MQVRLREGRRRKGVLQMLRFWNSDLPNLGVLPLLLESSSTDPCGKVGEVAAFQIPAKSLLDTPA